MHSLFPQKRPTIITTAALELRLVATDRNRGFSGEASDDVESLINAGEDLTVLLSDVAVPGAEKSEQPLAASAA